MSKIQLFPKSVTRALTVVALALFVQAFAGVSAFAAEPDPQGVVNINTATPDQLMLLPRIGESKAQRIVEMRQRAPFRTVNDLTRVKGIGLKSLRVLKPFVRVDGPTTLTSEAKPQTDEASEAPVRHTRAAGPNGGASK